jgi:alkanesulfonate monooxygenase SsuD/methylene tetrahydromethanopterin reductase-like flavin-dependent oxidoreductase (luciferase family)
VAGGQFPVVPNAAAGSRIPVLVGGSSEQAVERAVRYGDGWTGGGTGPEAVAQMMEKVRRAWHEAGREDEPRFAALVYFGLGDEKASRASLHRYYGFLGEWVEAIDKDAIRSPEAAKDTVRAFAGVGLTELAFIPTVPSLDEVDRLADAVL